MKVLIYKHIKEVDCFGKANSAFPGKGNVFESVLK